MIDKLKIEDVEHEAHPHMLTAICPKCNGNAGKKPVQFYECIAIKDSKTRAERVLLCSDKISNCTRCNDDGFIKLTRKKNGYNGKYYLYADE